MTTDSALATTSGDIEVIAETPQEMQESNRALIAWCDSKIKALRVDHIELDASYKAAVEHKWKSSTLKRHADLAKKRIEFYRKIKTALEHGYYIVPTFPVRVFAVRTDKDKPLALVSTSSWNNPPDKEQKPRPLPEGDGDYQNPFPEVWQTDLTDELPPEKKAKGDHLYQFYAKSFRELDFPLNMARPRIMEATNRAMALKLFDDFGVLPSPYRKADPMIIARIKDPRPRGYGEGRSVSFVIAWSLNTNTL
jgi:hypothetical protein